MAFFGRGAAVRRRAGVMWGDPSAAPHSRRRSTREADLSTQQARAQAPSRFSRTHGDHGRPQGGRRPAQAGPQAAQRLISAIITMLRLKQRADFLAAASGAKVATAAFVLQGRNRDDDGPARIGFTVSRKVGTAVERNRVRRRLRDIVATVGVGQPALGLRLRAGGTAHRAEPAVRDDDRRLQQRTATSRARRAQTGPMR